MTDLDVKTPPKEEKKEPVARDERNRLPPQDQTGQIYKTLEEREAYEKSLHKDDKPAPDPAPEWESYSLGGKTFQARQNWSVGPARVLTPSGEVSAAPGDFIVDTEWGQFVVPKKLFLTFLTPKQKPKETPEQQAGGPDNGTPGNSPGTEVASRGLPAKDAPVPTPPAPPAHKK